MTDANVHAAPRWWDAVKVIPASGWALLLGLGVAEGLVLLVCTALPLPYGPAGSVVELVIGGLVGAGYWWLALRLLNPGRPLAGPLRFPLLAVLLMLTDAQHLLLLALRADVLPERTLAFALVALPLMVYLMYVGLLVPMAVRVDGGGLGRALRLAHGSWWTVLHVLPLVLIGQVVAAGVQQLHLRAVADGPTGSSLLVVTAVGMLIGIAWHTLSTVLLHAAHRAAVHRLDPPRTPTDAPTGSAFGGPSQDVVAT
ncbi:hypothetical protein ACIRBX_20710 [Kitasatospora sp. NPDC096147]|uniref:hypothetical protein n=1 Tax=Kitasatospora sp. NPDC096147 TaxID=3364093 RepID=UPI00382AE6F0